MSLDAPEDFHPGGRARPRLGDLPERLLNLLRASPAGELESHLKAFLAQAIDKLDLVSREEFDDQCAMVERLRSRLEQLEAQQAERDAQG